jgi:hypothetical protein
VEEFYPICITSENYPGLSFQVGQFLKRSEESWVNGPIIMDLFTLDVITEFLRSPLYLIDYFAKRSLLFDKVLSSHELVLLAYHLRGNLFVPKDVSMMLVEDDFMIELDLAMAVRRRGLPGSATPSGILTRDLDNPVGRILVGADKTDRPEVHQLGELILNLSSNAWDKINRWVGGLAMQSRRDQKSHDVTVPLEEGGAGLTIHCNDLQQSEAFRKLASHCEIRKYIHKADGWFGVCFDPQQRMSGSPSGVLELGSFSRNLMMRLGSSRFAQSTTSSTLRVTALSSDAMTLARAAVERSTRNVTSIEAR